MTTAAERGRTADRDDVEWDDRTTSGRVTYETTERGGDVAYARDRVRWGPIVAGLLTALSTFIVLSLLATVLGLTAVDTRGANAGSAAQTGAVVGAVLGLIAFAVGGFVAAWTAGIRDRADGALNGFLVWALAIPIALLGAGLGLGQVLGAAGDFFGNYRNLNAAATNDRSAIVDAIRNGAGGALLGLLLPAIAATIGGWFGAREDAAVRTRTRNYWGERA